MNILFVCTGNTCRSTMAEGFMRKISAEKNLDNLQVNSCGTSASTLFQVPEIVLDIMDKEGVDLTSHRPKQINQEIIDNSDLILVMERYHKDYINSFFPKDIYKVYLLKEFVNEDSELEIPDPIGQAEEVYKETSNKLKEYVNKVIDKLINEKANIRSEQSK